MAAFCPRCGSDALGRPVTPQIIARKKGTTFREQGTVDPTLHIDMLDGFNSGWIEFEGTPANHVKGRVEFRLYRRACG